MIKNENIIEAFTEFSISVSEDTCELICDFIIDNITNGLVLEDEEGSDNSIIKFYVASNDDARISELLNSFLSDFSNAHEIEPITFTKQTVKNVSWEEEYKKSVKPVWINDEVVVVPTWSQTEYDARYKIVIEPKMAFGTGTHETTRSCLHVIYEELKEAKSFLDLGCGSGILSILADKLGVEYIKAIDYDIIAVDNTLENFEINQVEADYEILHGSIEQCENDESFDFVCANIIRSTILEMLPQLNKLTKKNGYLVLSGLLESDLGEIFDSLDGLKLIDRKVYQDNEWRTIIIRKQ